MISDEVLPNDYAQQMVDVVENLVVRVGR